nr:MAG TPA: hypothetical protein [Bacteriophage sp.]
MVDQAKPFVVFQRHADGISGEPLAVPAYLLNVERNDDVPDLPREPPFRVNGFQAQSLVEDDIICTVRLAHKEIHRIAVQKRLFQPHPVICFTCRHFANTSPSDTQLVVVLAARLIPRQRLVILNLLKTRRALGRVRRSYIRLLPSAQLFQRGQHVGQSKEILRRHLQQCFQRSQRDHMVGAKLAPHLCLTVAGGVWPLPPRSHHRHRVALFQTRGKLRGGVVAHGTHVHELLAVVPHAKLHLGNVVLGYLPHFCVPADGASTDHVLAAVCLTLRVYALADKKRHLLALPKETVGEVLRALGRRVCRFLAFYALFGRGGILTLGSVILTHSGACGRLCGGLLRLAAISLGDGKISHRDGALHRSSGNVRHNSVLSVLVEVAAYLIGKRGIAAVQQAAEHSFFAHSVLTAIHVIPRCAVQEFALLLGVQLTVDKGVVLLQLEGGGVTVCVAQQLVHRPVFHAEGSGVQLVVGVVADDLVGVTLLVRFVLGKVDNGLSGTGVSSLPFALAHLDAVNVLVKARGHGELDVSFVAKIELGHAAVGDDVIAVAVDQAHALAPQTGGNDGAGVTRLELVAGANGGNQGGGKPCRHALVLESAGDHLLCAGGGNRHAEFLLLLLCHLGKIALVLDFHGVSLLPLFRHTPKADVVFLHVCLQAVELHRRTVYAEIHGVNFFFLRFFLDCRVCKRLLFYEADHIRHAGRLLRLRIFHRHGVPCRLLCQTLGFCRLSRRLFPFLLRLFHFQQAGVLLQHGGNVVCLPVMLQQLHLKGTLQRYNGGDTVHRVGDDGVNSLFCRVLAGGGVEPLGVKYALPCQVGVGVVQFVFPVEVGLESCRLFLLAPRLKRLGLCVEALHGGFQCRHKLLAVGLRFSGYRQRRRTALLANLIDVGLQFAEVRPVLLGGLYAVLRNHNAAVLLRHAVHPRLDLRVVGGDSLLADLLQVGGDAKFHHPAHARTSVSIWVIHFTRSAHAGSMTLSGRSTSVIMAGFSSASLPGTSTWSPGCRGRFVRKVYACPP